MQAQITALQEQLLVANMQAAAAAGPASPGLVLPAASPHAVEPQQAPNPNLTVPMAPSERSPKRPAPDFEQLLASASSEPSPVPAPAPVREPEPEPEPLAMPAAQPSNAAAGLAGGPAASASAAAPAQTGQPNTAEGRGPAALSEPSLPSSLSPSALNVGELKRLQSGMSTSPGDDTLDSAVALKGENAREVARDLRRRAAAAALQRTSSGEGLAAADTSGQALAGTGNKLGGEDKKKDSSKEK
jgi:hypothetical protein